MKHLLVTSFIAFNDFKKLKNGIFCLPRNAYFSSDPCGYKDKFENSLWRKGFTVGLRVKE